MALNFSLAPQWNKAKMESSTTVANCRKIVGMPLIAFENVKDSGKSTQLKRLANRLGRQGSRWLLAGGTTIGKAIRHLLQHSEDDHVMTAETGLVLFEASRRQLVRQTIQLARCNQLAPQLSTNNMSNDGFLR